MAGGKYGGGSNKCMKRCMFIVYFLGSQGCQDPVHGVVGANLYSLREFQGLPAHHIRYENKGAHEHADSAIRESNDLHPYVAATLLEFESWLKMPGKIRCILDLTCGFPQPDKITEYAHASSEERQTDK